MIFIEVCSFIGNKIHTASEITMGLSGLQREVLSLYRKCLREVRKKPTVGIPSCNIMILSLKITLKNAKANFREHTRLATSGCFLKSYSIGVNSSSRSEFRKYLNVNKKDFATIEYLLRRGYKQLELYSLPGIRNISS